jgi:hypothetical protein
MCDHQYLSCHSTGFYNVLSEDAWNNDGTMHDLIKAAWANRPPDQFVYILGQSLHENTSPPE